MFRIFQKNREIVRIQDIIDNLLSYKSNANIEIIRKAYVYSAKMHDGQKRESGEPYLNHPLSVAYIVTQLKLDEASIVSGLLHDCLEDTLATPDEIKREFGDDVLFIVDGLTKLSKLQFREPSKRQIESIKKLFVAASHDLRVILIKLADRLHNMRTLQYVREDKQKRIAKETLELYAPLAHRLGIYWVKQELEDLSFKYLFPKEYEDIVTRLQKYTKLQDEYMNNVIEELKKICNKYGIEKFEVKSRIKSPYSIYQKMQKRNIAFEYVHDIIGFRIVTERIEDCYRILGEIHGKWKMVEGRFKDYISRPKDNNYQSLHTTVIGPQNREIEVQIRTFEMDEVAEKGIAAHWLYKEGRTINSDIVNKYKWLREILEVINESGGSQEEIQEGVQTVLQNEQEIGVFTPKREIILLPRGATPLDFAFAIHTEIGLHCEQAIVNGKIVPFDYQLQDGDTVYIKTSPKRFPSRDWEKIVVTSTAKRKIRQFLRTQELKERTETGRRLFEGWLKQYNIPYKKVISDKAFLEKLRNAGWNNVEEFFAHLANPKFNANIESLEKLIKAVIPENYLKQSQEGLNEKSIIKKVVQKLNINKGKSDILVDGIDNMLIQCAECCNPIHGDKIIGFVTSNRVVIVHRVECINVKNYNEDRKVGVSWNERLIIPRTVYIKVKCDNRPGMLHKLTKVFADMDINLNNVNAGGNEKTGIIHLKFLVTTVETLEKIINKLQRISGIYEISRY